MSLKQEWVKEALRLARSKAHLYTGCRKVLQCQTITFHSLDKKSLSMKDSGYTPYKTKSLVRHYLHEESKAVAMQLWEKRLGQAKYGSVGFTTYNHFVKGGTMGAPRSSRASVFGPCLQSVCLTLVDKRTTDIDVFYRSTEFFKKFGADLVFVRDDLLGGFDLSTFRQINFHFANISVHPMYFVTIVPLLLDPIEELQRLKKVDKYFHDWCVKWTARYVCDEYLRGIQKFAQAMRVKMDADNRIDKAKMRALQKYLRKNHPGHRNDYVDPDEED